jgi:hypothetical protein
MENKPKGGRGKIAPYQTVTVRIPLPIKPMVDKLSDDFRESSLIPIIAAIKERETKAIPLEDAIIKAQEIIYKGKKASKVSIERLLEDIYGQKVTINKPVTS